MKEGYKQGEYPPECPPLSRVWDKVPLKNLGDCSQKQYKISFI